MFVWVMVRDGYAPVFDGLYISNCLVSTNSKWSTINGAIWEASRLTCDEFFRHIDTVADTPLSFNYLLNIAQLTSNMLASYKCNYCGRRNLSTLKGLRSHITQSKICRDALRRITEKRAPSTKNQDDSNSEMSDDIQPIDQDVPMHFEGVEDTGDFVQPEPRASATRGQQPDRRARVEEVEDEESGTQTRWVKDFPRPAGVPGRPAQSYFEMVREKQTADGDSPWAPFQDEEEWGLAQFLINHVGQNATDKFLKLPIVSFFAL